MREPPHPCSAPSRARGFAGSAAHGRGIERGRRLRVDPKFARATAPCAVVIAFGLSRLLFHAAGVRFDASPLGYFWQFVDPPLLRTDLLRSLFYLHIQPPLFGLFIGLVLKSAPASSTQVFQLLYLLVGLGLHLGLYFLLVRLQVPRLVAVALVLLFLASPAGVLYENWLFYTYPSAAALVAATLFLHRFLSRRALRDGLAFFALVAAIALTRSMFHLVWCVLCAVLVLVASGPGERLRTLSLAAAPLALVALLYAKNAALFGEFASSSWMGMSLAKHTLYRMSETDREALLDRGVLSPLARIRPFSPLDAYPARYTDIEIPPVPVLELREKASGKPNYNHLAYVAISRQYLRDALAAIGQRPDVYARHVRLAFWLFAQPASQYMFLSGNRSRIAEWEAIYDRWVLGATGPGFTAGREREELFWPAFLRRNAAYGWMTLAAFGVAWGLLAGVRGLTTRGAGSPSGACLLFLSANVLYVAVAGNLLELGENHRFRFIVDPLVVALIGTLAAGTARCVLRGAEEMGIGCTSLTRRVKRRRRHREFRG